jgi:hypothetical protein
MSYYLSKEDGDSLLKEDSGALLLELVRQIEDFQSTWIQTHGVYFQALPSHTVPPSTSTQADNTSTLLEGKNISWNSSDMVVGTLPYSVEIWEYVTPEGNPGYQLLLRKNVEGVVVTKSIGYGPEASSRTWDWSI